MWTIDSPCKPSRYLKQANVPLNEFEFSWAKVSNIQPQLEKLISKNYFLNISAKEAYKVTEEEKLTPLYLSG